MVNSSIGFNIGRLAIDKYRTSSRESTLNLVKTHEGHVSGTGDELRNVTSATNQQNFGNLLISQVDKTSALENKATTLTTQFITDPESVNEHDVTIASTEATLAVSIMTNIVSRALESYRAIISLQ